MACFSVDTSAWLDGWRRHYPEDVFPSLWVQLQPHIDSGLIVSSEEVYIELKKKDDDLHAWMQTRKAMLIPSDEAVQERVIFILGKYPRLVDTLKGRSQCDPFVIAVALEKGGTVVTGEGLGSATRIRIPNVCRAEGIECISFLEMLRTIGLRF